MKTYNAPWSTSLIAVSSLVTVLCAGIAIGFILSGRSVLQWAALLPLAIIACGLLLTIRGYTVTPDAILVHRLLWTTRLPLIGLQSAKFEPDVMRGSIRTFGNGGLFSFSGFFRNKALGTYRAFVTDLQRTVVLRFPSRTVVVSPSAPEEFIHDIGGTSHAI
ncbi:MAG: hypothetical protein KF693_14075 [Nitrospira sp.]|nr:hypothetical protein [Nitrospira sp.]